MSLLSALDVHRSYAGEPPVHAVAGVTLDVAAGEFVAITGPSGCGKSTFLHLCGAMDRPSSGSIVLDGSALDTLDDDHLTRVRRERVGFVFQFFNLLPTLSALENVMLPSLLAGADNAEVRERGKKQLDAVGLKNRMGHKPDQLSGGEMQRVAIARALVSDPPLVLADEPTGNLDTKTGEGVLELLLGAATERRTVVLVTHDPRIAARADRVLSIRDGLVESDGPPPPH